MSNSSFNDLVEKFATLKARYGVFQGEYHECSLADGSLADRMISMYKAAYNILLSKDKKSVWWKDWLPEHTRAIEDYRKLMVTHDSPRRLPIHAISDQFSLFFTEDAPDSGFHISPLLLPKFASHITAHNMAVGRFQAFDNIRVVRECYPNLSICLGEPTADAMIFWFPILFQYRKMLNTMHAIGGVTPGAIPEICPLLESGTFLTDRIKQLFLNFCLEDYFHQNSGCGHLWSAVKHMIGHFKLETCLDYTDPEMLNENGELKLTPDMEIEEFITHVINSRYRILIPEICQQRELPSGPADEYAAFRAKIIKTPIQLNTLDLFKLLFINKTEKTFPAKTITQMLELMEDADFFYHHYFSGEFYPWLMAELLAPDRARRTASLQRFADMVEKAVCRHRTWGNQTPDPANPVVVEIGETMIKKMLISRYRNCVTWQDIKWAHGLFCQLQHGGHLAFTGIRGLGLDDILKDVPWTLYDYPVGDIPVKLESVAPHSFNHATDEYTQDEGNNRISRIVSRLETLVSRYAACYATIPDSWREDLPYTFEKAGIGFHNMILCSGHQAESSAGMPISRTLHIILRAFRDMIEYTLDCYHELPKLPPDSPAAHLLELLLCPNTIFPARLFAYENLLTEHWNLE